MATNVTTSDDESYRNEEANWEYDTPTEDDVREDRRSDQTIEERLDQALPSSLDDREAGERRMPNEELLARHGRLWRSNEGPRGVASGTVAVIETNRAPVLRKLDRKSILTFMERREKYLRNFRDANALGVPRSLVSMIETTVLETVCECEIGVDAEDLSEEEIKAWISQALVGGRSQDTQIERKMTKMKMNLRIESPGLRITDLYVQFNKVVKDNSCKHIFSDEDVKKMNIRFLVNSIEPLELKKMIQHKLRVEQKFAKQPEAFQLMLREKTKNHEETRKIRVMDEGNHSGRRFTDRIGH